MSHHGSLVRILSAQTAKSIKSFGGCGWLLFPLLFIIIAWVMSSVAVSETVKTVGKKGPAHVEHIADEALFNSITLEPKAEERLGIQTVLMERQTVTQTRLYGGALILPLNQFPAGSERSLSKEHQSVTTILPLMTPADQIQVAEAQINADGQIEVAKVQVQAAQVVLARAQRLLRDHAGSQRAVDNARVQFQLAQATLAEAKARRQMLGPLLLATMSPDRFWIRVPVYVGDLKVINPKQPASVSPFGDPHGPAQFVAYPASGPPSANPIAATIDLFYQIDNPPKEWQLGQKIQVFVPLKQMEKSLVVPWSAVVMDMYGGTWVYNKTGPYTYVRDRVLVGFVMEGKAVLASGPTPGTEIVTHGAAELFGIEVGFSH